MRKILIISISLMLFSAIKMSLSFAEPANPTTSVPFKVIILDVRGHADYKFLNNGIKRISGVTDLMKSAVKQNSIVLTGMFSSDPASLLNDVQALTMDRFKFEQKKSGDRVVITLKKL